MREIMKYKWDGTPIQETWRVATNERTGSKQTLVGDTNTATAVEDNDVAFGGVTVKHHTNICFIGCCGGIVYRMIRMESVAVIIVVLRH